MPAKKKDDGDEKVSFGKRPLFALITLLQPVLYLLVILLWFVGTLLMIFTKKPFINAGIIAMHLVESITVGVKTGLAAGEKLIYSIVMCMTFGFTWWVPLKFKKKIK